MAVVGLLLKFMVALNQTFLFFLQARERLRIINDQK